MTAVKNALAPGSMIGILGGGQLARMLTLAAARLGLNCHIFAPEADSPAFAVAAAHTMAAYDDEAALAQFAAAVDVVTYEFENVPAATARFLAARRALAPNAQALATAQDRVDEKTFIAGLGIPVAPFAAVEDEASLLAAVGLIGLPSILKTRRFGYDGKGQIKLTGDLSPQAAWAEIGKAPAILEGFVAFDKEISVIAARGADGSVAVYDVPENVHRDHTLHTSTVPAAIPDTVRRRAQEIGDALVTALDYVGVMGIELFVAGEAVIVNEIAPRVHNSGHWTMDACHISQFEQHIRAVAGWPLGSPVKHADVVMTNLLGDDIHRWAELAQEPDVALHIYGKAEARRGRKMGHINRLTPRQPS